MNIEKEVRFFSEKWRFKKLKERVKQFQNKRKEILEIKKEIFELEENEEVKRYLKLQDILEEKTTGRNTGFDRFTDEKLISIALGEIYIIPDEEIYVYIGTYKYNREIDIIHGSNDILVSRNNREADYVIYQNLESKYNGTIEVPYKEADEFETNHKIIFSQNISREAYFYKLQAEYFETMILESPEIASKKINKLIKK